MYQQNPAAMCQKIPTLVGVMMLYDVCMVYGIVGYYDIKSVLYETMDRPIIEFCGK
jgi:hypothetical protein